MQLPHKRWAHLHKTSTRCHVPKHCQIQGITRLQRYLRATWPYSAQIVRLQVEPLYFLRPVKLQGSLAQHLYYQVFYFWLPHISSFTKSMLITLNTHIMSSNCYICWRKQGIKSLLDQSLQIKLFAVPSIHHHHKSQRAAVSYSVSVLWVYKQVLLVILQSSHLTFIKVIISEQLYFTPQQSPNRAMRLNQAAWPLIKLWGLHSFGLHNLDSFVAHRIILLHCSCYSKQQNSSSCLRSWHHALLLARHLYKLAQEQEIRR